MLVLYKYMTAERALTCLPVVGDGTLRATQPAALNDPFECAVQMGSVQSNGDEDNRQLAQALSNLNGTTPVTERDVRKAKFYYGSLYVRTLLTKQLSQRFGIVSFTTDPRHPLMWSHYTFDGSGFVIGYAVEHIVRLVSNPERLRPVSYRSELERIFGYDALGYSDNNLIAALSVKSNFWSYESEWRLIVELNETIGTGQLDAHGQSINLVRVPNEAVVSVFHTERTSQETVAQIRSRLEGPNNRYSTNRLTKLVLATGRYEYEDEKSAELGGPIEMF